MKIKCKKCGDIIQADKKGHLIWCNCGACFIDETKWYARVGYKNIEDFEEIKENEDEPNDLL